MILLLALFCVGEAEHNEWIAPCTAVLSDELVQYLWTSFAWIIIIP